MILILDLLESRNNSIRSGVPHLSTEGDVYEGYHIPKGSIVIPNSWYEDVFALARPCLIMTIHHSYRAMLHNEDDYPDPSTFKPERFIKNGQLDPNIRDPFMIAFGFGRRYKSWMIPIYKVVKLITEQHRSCPGSHIARSTIWIAAASILATFDLSKSVDKDGRVIEPSREYLSTIIRWLKAQSVILEIWLWLKQSSSSFWMHYQATLQCSWGAYSICCGFLLSNFINEATLCDTRLNVLYTSNQPMY